MELGPSGFIVKAKNIRPKEIGQAVNTVWAAYQDYHKKKGKPEKPIAKSVG